MNKLKQTFMMLKKAKRKAFIAYITAGYPDNATFNKLLFQLEKGGVDAIEIGIPFSDPLADGPTIQHSSQKMLQKGMSCKKAIGLIGKAGKHISVPIVFMAYFNVIYSFGIKRFITESKKAGVSGVIVPDLPIEESGQLMKVCRREDFDLIFLAAPTTDQKRMKEIVKKSKGFIYYVSLTGVTGARKNLAFDIRANVKKIKAVTDKPVCVGFGISNAQQARYVSAAADGIIIGSAIIKIIEKSKNKPAVLKNVFSFTKNIRKAIDVK